MDELKPCPFCGGKARLRTVLNSNFVECGRCWSHGPTQPTKYLAITAWNRRAAPENKPLTLEHVDCKTCQFEDRDPDEEPCRHCKGAYPSRYAHKPEGSESHGASD